MAERANTKVLPCHRNERSHEIALRLRELIALSPSLRADSECSVHVNMPSHGQKSKDKSLDSSENGKSVLEHARTGSLDGESATNRRETSGVSLLPASDTTCSNRPLALRGHVTNAFSKQ